MAAYISFQPSDYFNTTLYTGNGTTDTAITGVGFQSDFTWIKNRSVTDNNVLTDAVRGVTKVMNSNNNTATGTDGEGLTAFGADGFTVGNDGPYNGSAENLVAWNWKAGTTSGLSGGTITPSSYSINTTAGFGIYKYGGNATAGATIAHGLGAAPKFLITKKESTAGDWHIAHQSMFNPWNSYCYLNTSNGIQENDSATWFLNDTAPDATNITLGSGAGINGSGVDYMIYAFVPKKGYSQFGGYKGNGNVNGPFIYTGFRPAYVMIKSYWGGASGAGAWAIFDTKRLGYNVNNDHLVANETQIESTDDVLDILSNGFKIRATTNMVNGSSWDYMYMAFAESPIVSSNDIPTVAR